MAVERERLFEVDRVCRRLLVYLEKTIEWAWNTTVESTLAAWSEADYLADRTIVINDTAQRVTGRYAGIHESGRLRLIDPTGKEHLFWSGDVSVEAG